MQKFFTILIVLIGLFVSQSQAADTLCPTCTYGTAVQDSSGLIVRFSDSIATTVTQQNNLVTGGFGFTAVTATDACNDNVCGSGSEVTCTGTSDANVFQCGCAAQYEAERKTQSFSCIDLDECSNSTLHNCSAVGGNCTNEAPGFSCSCVAGYTGDGINCTDFDECSANAHNCSVNATCTNTDPGFTCACKSEYTGDGFTCTDLDECSNSTLHNCSAVGGNCTNEAPGFSCSCVAGYTGDGTTCTDFDECAANVHNCSVNATCINTDPGFTCACKSEYTGDGFTCTDLDECSNSTLHNCSATRGTCTNEAPGFSCSCVAGYTGDGINCTDVSECASNPCDTNANCTEPIANNYTCTCHTGYTGNGTTCTNIDECSTSTPCDGNATCTDNTGSFSCACKTGYTGDGFSCTDIDDCASNPCHADATCTDLVNSHSCACNTGFSGDGVTSCEKQRINITISFVITCTNQAYDAVLSDNTSSLYQNITTLLKPAVDTFITSVDSAAAVNSLSYNFTNSTDGFGSAQATVDLVIGNTNIDAVDFLKKVNTILENTQCGATASADECALGIDSCPSEATCGNTDFGYCCYYSFSYRFQFKYDVTFVNEFLNLTSPQSDELFDDIEEVARRIVVDAQNRGCFPSLIFTREGAEQGSTIGVMLAKMINGTKTADQIENELKKAVNQTTSFGTIIGAGDYDECARNYTQDRNCSVFANCLNFAGTFTCECNNTYYDNGTTTNGELCIVPVTIDCNGTRATISVIKDYYERNNVSLDSLHLADEACNRTTHAQDVGDTIEFSLDLNNCNTTLSQSADNSSIIASNYISNVPSSGFFTGFAINVPFQCNIPASVNTTTQFNSSVAQIQFPSSGATGGATVQLTAFTDQFATPLASSTVLSTVDLVYLQAQVLDVAGISVAWVTLEGTDGSNKVSLIENGCPTKNVPNFELMTSTTGLARCSFQAFTFVRSLSSASVESVDVVANVMLCAGNNCQPTCSRRRRRDISDLKLEGTEPVELSISIRVRADMNNSVIIDGIVVGAPSTPPPSSDVHDITLPIVAAILAFVLILLLALAVVVIVRKNRYANKEYDISHVNMHAIGVKPPSYE